MQITTTLHDREHTTQQTIHTSLDSYYMYTEYTILKHSCCVNFMYVASKETGSGKYHESGMLNVAVCVHYHLNSVMKPINSVFFSSQTMKIYNIRVQTVHLARNDASITALSY